MKAEDIAEGMHHTKSFKDEVELIKEYARIQIEKDRERIKAYNFDCDFNDINETPIILD